MMMNNKKYLDYILNTQELSKQSVNYTRGVKFFKLHPEALSVFINNFNRSPRYICEILLSAGIFNPAGVSYSQATITAVKRFLQDINILNIVNSDSFENN